MFANMHYELSDLRILLAVAEEGNLSRGAERAHLAVSSVSQRIKGLEESIGTPLLIRKARGVALTPAGHIVVEHARRCIAQLNQMNADLLPFSNGLTGHVTLFATNLAINSYLPTDLERFFSKFPSVRLTLEEKTSSDITAAVAAGRADLGVCALTTEHPDLEYFPYRTDRLVLLTSPGSELARNGIAPFEACANEPFVSLQQGTSLHTFLAGNAAALGMRLDIRVQVSGYAAIVQLVSSGAGIGIVPKSAVNEEAYPNLRVIELSDTWARQDLHVCRLRDQSTRNHFPEGLVEALCSQPAESTSLQNGRRLPLHVAKRSMP